MLHTSGASVGHAPWHFLAAACRRVLAVMAPFCAGWNASLHPSNCEVNGFTCNTCKRTCGLCRTVDANYQALGAKVDTCMDGPHVRCADYLFPWFTNDTLPPVSTTGRCEEHLPAGAEHGRWSDSKIYGLQHTSASKVNLSSKVDVGHDAAAARRCLSRNPLLFVGDSNMRYQYLALVHYLHHGSWDAWPRVNDRGFAVSLCNEKSADHIVRQLYPNSGKDSVANTWRVYYNASTFILGDRESCECERRGHSTGGNIEKYSLSELDPNPRHYASRTYRHLIVATRSSPPDHHKSFACSHVRYCPVPSSTQPSLSVGGFKWCPVACWLQLVRVDGDARLTGAPMGWPPTLPRSRCEPLHIRKVRQPQRPPERRGLRQRAVASSTTGCCRLRAGRMGHGR